MNSHGALGFRAQADQDTLISRHPGLREVQFQRLGHFGISDEALSSFVEDIWSEDYREELRIRFDQYFFAYNMIDENASVVALKDGKLVGLFLAIPINNLRRCGGAVATALTVRKEYRGEGIAQMLYLTQLQALILQNYDFCVYWFDSRHSNPGSSTNIFCGKNFNLNLKKIPIYCKVTHRASARSLGVINSAEGYMTGFLQRIQNILHRKPVGVDVVSTGPRVSDFMGTRFFLPEPRSAKSSESDSRYLQFRFVRDGNLRGTLLGFFNGYRDSVYFQVDALHFASNLGYREKLGFLTECEQALTGSHGCLLIVVPGSVSDENMSLFGYLPYVSQVMAFHDFRGRVDVKQQFICLR